VAFSTRSTSVPEISGPGTADSKGLHDGGTCTKGRTEMFKGPKDNRLEKKAQPNHAPAIAAPRCPVCRGIYPRRAWNWISSTNTYPTLPPGKNSLAARPPKLRRNSPQILRIPSDPPQAGWAETGPSRPRWPVANGEPQGIGPETMEKPPEALCRQMGGDPSISFTPRRRMLGGWDKKRDRPLSVRARRRPPANAMFTWGTTGV